MADTPQKYIHLQKRIEDVRAREVARLIKLADKAGYFKYKILTPELLKAFNNLIKTGSKPNRASQLSTLSIQAKQLKAGSAKKKRQLDARRKILLGAFLVAQFSHKPQFHTDIIPKIEDYLQTTKNQSKKERYKELLAKWLILDGVKTIAKNTKEKKRSGRAAKEDNQRLILLGAFFIWLHATKPELLIKMDQELLKFINIDKNPISVAQNRELVQKYIRVGGFNEI